MNRTRINPVRPARGARRTIVGVVVALTTTSLLMSCTGSSNDPSTDAGSSSPLETALPAVTDTVESAPVKTVATPSAVNALQPVTVVFDTPGSDPRPLREVPVVIDGPTKELTMNITELSYRGLVCGFTFTGERPPSPVQIDVVGDVAAGQFSSGPVDIVWDDAGVVKTGQPQSNNGWSFSADAYPNRNGPGWAISLGAVTGEAENVVPKSATCRLRSAAGFAPANSPVGYWAGFATR